ncbi:Thioredoxin-like fold protein [Cordyceps fumosorosea ARSEF 2679]|uniref:Thioredoxin peroxidase n=1 Tax=Cordyceps fumosorosea (strain ARSEF 2679) TaxID=1081104 RepID=A0A162JQB6_CORFA|nr:Thioredoxin-like fold protein [Cordyceps fumosorosea ARSEF 2679]OAA72212.1 Thioredoxin-like fold protein [Cordyceps fumosorosea ARSEF 2679]
MSALKVGDSFPEDVIFGWVRPSPETADFEACGVPTKFPASSQFRNKKVVIVSVPGAFTPTCSANHIPGFIKKTAELKAKGVDQVVVIACNDAWVMSAWGKANKIHDEFIIFASDEDCKFSKSIGWMAGPGRTGRYAIVVDHGKVTYAELEPAGGVTVSGADEILPKL